MASSSSLPVTGYILHNGRANLSLWPFGGGKSPIPPPADAIAREQALSTSHDPAASKAAETASSLSSQTSDAVNAAASNAQDTASSLAAQAQSTLQDASSATAATLDPIVDSALHITAADTAPPTFLENITQIGQLKEIGLDFGWGPTAMVEWVVEHVHVYGGLPWFGTIVASSIIMRVIMIYPFFKMSNQQAKMSRLQPQMKPLVDAARDASISGDNMAKQIASKQMQILQKRHGISMGWMFAPILVQGFFGYGAFKLLRNMAELPAPGFETGGFAWMPNLAVADPTYVTPVAMWVAMHLVARVSHSFSET